VLSPAKVPVTTASSGLPFFEFLCLERMYALFYP
jgi:hypothetical protein